MKFHAETSPPPRKDHSFAVALFVSPMFAVEDGCGDSRLMREGLQGEFPVAFEAAAP